MRNLRHLTPRYIIDRAMNIRYERANPELPWLTAQANQILSTLLRPDDVGLEFGSGRSTLWFAQHVGHLTSVEHDQAWHESVSRAVADRSISNVECVFAPAAPSSHSAASSQYVSTAERFEPGTLDFALVDGVFRGECALAVLPRLRQGGYLIIDNVNWYLPSKTAARCPATRGHLDGPDGPVWEELSRAVEEWRAIWTSNGVWDTAIFFKP